MTISMGLAALVNLAALGVVAGAPGWLLYQLRLQRLGLSWRVGVALAMAIQSVVFSDLASVIGYSLPVMLAAFAVLVAAGLAGWAKLARHGRRHDSSTPAVVLPDILFHLLIFSIFFVPALTLFLPLDTDAQGFGYLALMVREGGTIHTLSPWHPEVEYLYSPSAFVWWAFFSDLLRLPLHQVMLPFSHIAAGLLGLLGIDLAETLMPGRPRARWLLPLMMVAGMGLFLTVMDAAYTSVLGFLFVALFLVLAFQSTRFKSQEPVIWSAVALAAVALTHPDTIIILLIGYVPFYVAFWLSQSQHRTWAVWVRLFVMIPGLGLALTIPWLLRVWPLFLADHIVSPFTLSLDHLSQLILYQGGLIPLLALGGLVIAARRRWLPDMLMVVWVILIVDFSLFGAVDRVVDVTGLDLMRYVYPFSVAWHGPIIAYPYLAALALDRLLDRWRFTLPRLASTALPAAGLFILMLVVLAQRPLLRVTRPWISFYGAFSSQADLAAMTYLRENAPEEALILNYPVGFEGHWVPVIAERESVAFREQPFFSGAEPLYTRTAALREVYFDLGRPDAHDLLLEHEVAYIIIPQLVADPGSFSTSPGVMRWRWPEDTWYPLHSLPADQAWLELVFEQEGAQVWRVLP